MPARFTPFGLLHLVTVVIVVAIIALATWWGRSRTHDEARRFGRVLGVTLLVYYAIEGFVRVTWLHTPPIFLVPGELCSALFFIGAFALLTEHAVAFEVLFFWTFAGTIHALVTPTPNEGFPSLEYVRYFACHGLLVLVATYAVLALDRPMTWRSLVRAAIALQLWEFLVALFDWAFDQNFMYLRRPPPSPTLIDSLGPWPWYLVSLELVAIASFALWLGILSLTRRALPPREDRVRAPSPSSSEEPRDAA